MELLRDKVVRNIFVRKERLYLQRWHEWATKQRKYLTALSSNIFKSHAQKAMDKIRKYSLDKHAEFQK